ncbi:MAG: quinone oxidoreductase [Rhodospirillales bacterium]|nr:quinone oxidoreductase [Rhodospirillales bacterium]
MKAQAVIFKTQGAPSVLEIVDVEVAAPGDGQALIEHTAIGLNFIDIYHRGGQYPMQLPSGLGSEAAGVVLETGPGVTAVKPGDRVVYAGGPPGSYASHRLYPAARLVKIPDAISDEVAASVMLKGMTAEYLLNRTYPVKAGEMVLFHAASGGVGQLAGQWGRHMGAVMIGVAGGADKCAIALNNGYSHAIDRKTEDIAARVKEITGGAGVPVVYDPIGAASFDASLQSLAPRGYFVSFGSVTGEAPAVAPSTLQKAGSLYFTRPTLVTYTASREDLEMSANAVFHHIENGVLSVNINQRYPFDQVAKAHRDLEMGLTTGSSVLLP